MKASVVREIAQLRQGEFLKTLAMLRAQVDLHIMEAATQSLKGANIAVPVTYVGREPYDVVEMGKALVEQLQADGYVVTGTFLQFRVSWDKAVSPRNVTDDIVVVKSTKKR